MSNSNEKVNNSTNNSTNEIENRVKGMTACRVPEDDCISRQAAIDAIHNLYAIHGSEGSWVDQKDAFKAIKDLPSVQPTRPNTPNTLKSLDCIDRQAAIDALIKADYEFTGILSEPRARMFEQTINALPSAQLEICDTCGHRHERKLCSDWCDVWERGVVSHIDFCSRWGRRTDEQTDER